MQAAEPRPQFGRLQARDRFAKRLWFEIEKERHGQTLHVVNAFRGLHGRAGQDTRTPGLTVEAFGKDWRELLQPVGVVRLADQRKGQLASLCKIIVVNLEPLNRGEFSRKKVEDLGVER